MNKCMYTRSLTQVIMLFVLALTGCIRSDGEEELAPVVAGDDTRDAIRKSGGSLSGESYDAKLDIPVLLEDMPIAEPRAPDKPAVISEEKIEFKGDKWNQKVSLDFRDAAISDVIRSLATMYKVNIMAVDNLDRRITLKLHDISLANAFDRIMQLGGYRYIMDKEVVVVQGKSNALSPRIIELNTASPKDVEVVISSYLKTGNIAGSVSISEELNRIIVIAPADELEKIVAMARRLDRRPRQVIIRASIVAIDASSFFNFGIRWGGPGVEPASGIGAGAGIDDVPPNLLTFPSHFSNTTKPNLKIDALKVITGNIGFPGPSSVVSGGQITLGSIVDQLAIDAQIDALVSKGKAKILSQPRIGVLSHHTAKIIVGQEVLFSLETTATGSGNAVQSNQFREAGVTLEVTPVVGDDGFITIALKPEVSSFIGDITTAESPPIKTTRAETTVCIKDRHTAVIGGLVTRTDSQGDNGAPGLRRVPLVKFFFSSRSHAWQQQEIIVLITPYIVPSGDKWPTHGKELANPQYVPWKKNPEHMGR